MIIEFTADKPQNWLQHIAKQFGVELEENTINFPSHMGEGFLRHYYLTNGITLNYLRFRFYQEITFSRKAGKEVPFSPIMFYIHEKKCKQDIEDEIKEIFSNSPNGVFWPSSHISSVWKFPVNEWLSNITIAINHEWLLKNCDSGKGNYIHQLLTSGKPFYVFEEITSEMHQIISDIVDIIGNNSHACVANLFLESKSTELLALFIEKLVDRPLNENTSNLNSSDVEKLFKIKEIILKNISDTPSLNKLADTVGFSESKLQKSFKQVFGKSIYQYALYEKMLVAQKMLKSKKYSVSEVGYELGYSNLSHFTKAFKNQFGVNPKTYASKTHYS
ncbi:Regulatory protein PchR [Salinivirga cyanobacteriivorans]|uniref:Regulatory protein PchR n=1 Tax=Salinivirga cyanobacteriivorans TaxID=1307839 RepID=A0A0S2I3G8_9BACT|nr:AraC family transcriptional regulator [Salinivirga cyanobacteriivorans]ALO16794.1 Regulatory protein PchR [Salinivirga cyanobacteriivorans]